MKGSVDLRFLPPAQERLGTFGRVARRLFPVVIRDQLVGLAPETDFRPIPADKLGAVLGDAQTDGPADPEARWYEIPLLEDYSAIVKPHIDEGQVTSAIIAAIFDKREIEGLRGGDAQVPSPSAPDGDT
jgi:hypothetical protein